jgi:hypothetical protein
MAILDSEKALKDHKFDKSDTRIFFFDHSLSELFNLYTQELLNTFHTKSIKRQHYHWNKSNLYWKTIVTKINRDYTSPEVLREYSKFIERMYKLNAGMWEQLRKFHSAAEGLRHQAEYMNVYWELDEAKTTLLNEIDIYCGLEPYNEKEYNG